MATAAVVAFGGAPSGCAPPRAGQPADSAGWVALRGHDTVLVERAVLGDGEVRGTIAIGRIGRIVYDLATGDTLRVRARVGAQADTASGDARELTLSVADTAATIVHGGCDDGRCARTVRFTAPPGATAYLGPSIGLLDALVRGARRRPAARPVVTLPTGVVQGVHVEPIDGDSVRVVLDENEWRLQLDASGGLAGGRNVTRGWRLQRVPWSSARTEVVRLDRRAPAPGTGPYGPPPGAPYAAVEVRIPVADRHVLAGTLTVPARPTSPAPAVLLVSGSSPQDRDMAEGDSPYRPLRELADTLSRRGMVVLRVDDRGVGASTGDFARSTTADRAADARAALAFLRARREVDPSRVAVVGLSEGGVIAPMLAAADPTIAAIALLGAAGSRGAEYARWQIGWQVRADPRVPESGRDSAREARVRQWLARRDPWTRWVVDHDPRAVARRVRRAAVLVLHGENDRNVPPAHATALADAFRAAGNPDVTVRVLPGVSHPMLADPVGTPAAELYLHTTDMAPEVTGTVVEWLVARLGAARH